MSKEKSKHDVASEKRTPQSPEEYRVQEYLRLGFSQYQAHILAGQSCNGLYVACVRENYINKGCTPEEAFRILEP